MRWPVGRWQISPDSHWLATGGSDGTVRIQDAAPGQARALMRVDNIIFAHARLGTGGLAVGGPGRPVPLRLADRHRLTVHKTLTFAENPSERMDDRLNPAAGPRAGPGSMAL